MVHVLLIRPRPNISPHIPHTAPIRYMGPGFVRYFLYFLFLFFYIHEFIFAKPF